MSLMAGVRPEQARAIDWEQDVDLDGNPPSVAVPRGPMGGEARSRLVGPGSRYRQPPEAECRPLTGATAFYRDIRAHMEQTPKPHGLDHRGRIITIPM